MIIIIEKIIKYNERCYYYGIEIVDDERLFNNVFNKSCIVIYLSFLKNLEISSDFVKYYRYE